MTRQILLWTVFSKNSLRNRQHSLLTRFCSLLSSFYASTHPIDGPEALCVWVVCPSMRACAVVKMENLWRGNIFWVVPKFQHGPLPWWPSLSDADASEYSMSCLPFFFDHYAASLQQATVIYYFAHMLSNLEVRECCLPIMRGAGTLFPCFPKHFSHFACVHTYYFAHMLSFGRIQPFLQCFAYRSCAFLWTWRCGNAVCQ